MKKNNLIKVFLLSGLVFLGTTSCTNLEEQVLDGNIQSSSAGTIDTHAFFKIMVLCLL
jgi:hypothetical protein